MAAHTRGFAGGQAARNSRRCRGLASSILGDGHRLWLSWVAWSGAWCHKWIDRRTQDCIQGQGRCSRRSQAADRAGFIAAMDTAACTFRAARTSLQDRRRCICLSCPQSRCPHRTAVPHSILLDSKTRRDSLEERTTRSSSRDDQLGRELGTSVSSNRRQDSNSQLGMLAGADTAALHWGSRCHIGNTRHPRSSLLMLPK